MKRTVFEKLISWKQKKSKKPLILLGARQVGKTYILQRFGEQLFQKHFYINFEKESKLCNSFEKDLDPKRIIKELEIYLNSSINLKSDLLILDEIQNCPRAVTSLKYFNEDIPGFAICACGSLLGVTLGQESFPVGKVELLNMYPMSFFEFLEAIGELKLLKYLKEWNPKEKLADAIHSKAFDLLKIYFVTGGLPESILTFMEYKEDLLNALNKVREKQEILIKTHLADIAKHSGKENSMHVERVWSNIPSQLAREHDATAPKYKIKGVVPKLKSYSRLAGTIDWLEASGLILRIPIINSGMLPLKAYSNENTFKLFIYDVGILGALSNLNPGVILNYNYGTYKGYFAENFIAQEFTASLGKADKLYAWSESQSELEFVREVNDKVIPIEVKSGWNIRSRSIRVFMEKYKPTYGIIFSAQNFGIDKEKRLHRYPIYLASRFPY